MFSKFLTVVGFAILLFLVGGFFLPKHVHVERSIEIRRPAAPVFALLNSYRTFASWSPWAERDPQAKFEFSGPEAGVGARMSWSGDPRLVGSGWQEITESVPHSLVRTRMFFDQQGAAVSYFQLDETPNGVQVTWGFDTDLTEGQGFLGGLMARYFGLMFDRWIGTDYEQGLARLKTYAEGLPLERPARPEIEQVDVPPVDILFVRVEPWLNDGGSENTGMADSLRRGFQKVADFMAERDIDAAGRPMAINRSGGEQGYELLAAIPFVPGEFDPTRLDRSEGESPDIGPVPNVEAGTAPSGPAVRIVHHGSYDGMNASYQKLTAYMDVHELKEGPSSWEQYVTDPEDTADKDLVTYLYYQVEP